MFQSMESGVGIEEASLRKGMTCSLLWIKENNDHNCRILDEQAKAFVDKKLVVLDSPRHSWVIQHTRW